MFPHSLTHLLEVGRICDECFVSEYSDLVCERSQMELISACMKKYFYRLD